MSRKLITALVLALSVVLVWQQDGASVGNRSWATMLLVAYWILLNWALGRSHSEQSNGGCKDFIVAFATETGTARKLANKTARYLRKLGLGVAVTELNDLRNLPPPARGVLVVASTTGQGDAPRTGARWLDDGDLPVAFGRINHGILALGDRSYPQFCGFGYVVAEAFGQLGSRPYWGMVQVHREDPQSIGYWFSRLEGLADSPGETLTSVDSERSNGLARG